MNNQIVYYQNNTENIAEAAVTFAMIDPPNLLACRRYYVIKRKRSGGISDSLKIFFKKSIILISDRLLCTSGETKQAYLFVMTIRQDTVLKENHMKVWFNNVKNIDYIKMYFNKFFSSFCKHSYFLLHNKLLLLFFYLTIYKISYNKMYKFPYRVFKNKNCIM